MSADVPVRAVPSGWRVAPAVVLAAMILAWPMWAGMVAANDDLKFVRTVDRDLGVAGAVAKAWRSSPAFRPVEVALGTWTDPWSLECPAAMPMHALGLAGVLTAIAAMSRRAAPGLAWAGPLAMILFLLSPATTAALWQVDTVSQTWSAAIGCWAMVLAWDAAAAFREGRKPVRMTIALGALMVLGCSVKETGYGWSLAIGLGTMALAATAWRSDRAAAWRTVMLLVPVAVLPLAHAVLRVTTGALGGVAAGEEGARYSADLGLNLVVNAAFSVAGVIGTGPFHAVTDAAAPGWVRALPFVAVVAAVGAFSVAGGFAVLHRGSAQPVRWAGIGFFSMVAMLSTSATLPMGSVGELYGMGANAGAAVALAAALCALWNPLADDERTLGRVVAAASGSALVAIGAFGLAGRAEGFRVTWEVTRLLNDAIVTHLRAMPEVTEDADARPGIVHFGSSCLLGRTYGQYVVPPVQAIGVKTTAEWLRAVEPRRPLRFSLEPAADMEPTDLELPCTDLPRRGHW